MHKAFLDRSPPMPVVARLRSYLETGTSRRNAVRVVEADQSRPVRRMQRERIGQSVWPFLGRPDALDLELDPIALFEMMDASIKC